MCYNHLNCLMEEGLTMLDAFASRLQLLMDEQDMNAADLERATKIKQMTIGRYLKKERTPNVEYVVTLAKYFGVSVDWLLGVTDTREQEFSEEATEVARLYAKKSKAAQRIILTVLTSPDEDDTEDQTRGD